MSDSSDNLSPERARARACGLKLLEISTSYETCSFSGELESLAPVMALVARARRLLEAAYLLTDAGLELEAAGPRRTLLEYVLALQWLLEEPVPWLMLWQRDDAWMRIVTDDTCKSTGAGAMTAETRAVTQAFVDDLDSKLAALEVNERRMPKVRTLAGPKSFAYVAYRFDSQIGTHPSMKAAEQLLSRDANGSLRLHRDPPAGELGQPETYGHCAISLARIFTMIEQTRHDPMTAMVDPTALDEVVAALIGE